MYMQGDWIRTCQECGHIQKAVEPKGEMTNSYRNSKCRHCKSESLDYGKIYRSDSEKDSDY